MRANRKSWDGKRHYNNYSLIQFVSKFVTYDVIKYAANRNMPFV